jgi:hypothetical protein
MWHTACCYSCFQRYSFKAKPSFLVSHELPLEDAVEACKRFDERDKGWTKVILKPAAASRPAKGRKAASVAKG